VGALKPACKVRAVATSASSGAASNPEVEELEAADIEMLARDGGIVGSWGTKVGRAS
jgi:hypothetical protein